MSALSLSTFLLCVAGGVLLCYALSFFLSAPTHGHPSLSLSPPLRMDIHKNGEHVGKTDRHPTFFSLDHLHVSDEQPILGRV